MFWGGVSLAGYFCVVERIVLLGRVYGQDLIDEGNKGSGPGTRLQAARLHDVRQCVLEAGQC